MKIRGIGEHRQVRFFGGDRASQLAKLPPDPGNMRDHLDQPDDGNGSRIDDRPDAGGLHSRSGAAEKFERPDASAHRLHHTRSIKVARSFPGRDQDAHLNSSLPEKGLAERQSARRRLRQNWLNFRMD